MGPTTVAPAPPKEAIASLPIINFSALSIRDPQELDRLLDACKGLGFFYLDLRGPASNNILQDWR